MAYEKKSIRAILDDVNCRRVYLPAIQRKYVWGDNQITKLMDSIMLGYPIGTFLFWKVKKPPNSKSRQFKRPLIILKSRRLLLNRHRVLNFN